MSTESSVQLAIDCQFAALDFESAGALRGKTDVPVQIGWGLLAQGMIDGSSLQRHYLRTDRPITWAAQKTHGIKSEDLQDAPSLLELWPDLKAAFRGRVMVAHGRGTEQRFLRVFPGHGFEPWVDTLTVARSCWPGLESYALADVVAACHGEDELRLLCPNLNWHDALFDAVACLVILLKLLEKFPDLSLEALLVPDTSAYFRGRK